MSEPTARYKKGLATRRAVLGEAYVDAALAATDAFNADFQTLITEAAWGSVWSRETISKRERSMLTIALLAALGRCEEIPMHICATRNTGASMDDVKEALLHVAIYAGVPAAHSAYKFTPRATHSGQFCEANLEE